MLSDARVATKGRPEFFDGEKIFVLRSKVMFENSDILLAGTVMNGGQELVPRDAQGFPRWSRGLQR